MAPPSVSVILSVKNGEKFLHESITSVTQQSHAALEVLVLDNGSSDSTRGVAESFDPQLVRYFSNERDIGIAASRNRGIQLTRGDLIAFTSYDDLWLPDKLRAQCECFAQDSDLQYCLTHVRCFSERSESGESAVTKSFPREYLGRDVPGWIIETLVARRSAFERIGFFDETFSQADDTEWFVRAQNQRLSMVMLPEVLVLKRLHRNSLTYRATSAGTARRELLEIARRSIAERKSD